MLERISLMTFTMDIDAAMKKQTVEACLTMAKAAGLAYVDVMEPSKRLFPAYQAACKASGVQVYCYIGTVSFFSNSAETIRQTMLRQLDDAAALGAKLYMLVPMKQGRDEKLCARLGAAAVRERLVLYFSMAAALAAEREMRACFETTPWEYTLLSGADDCRWVLERVDGLGLVYDTANMLPHGDAPDRAADGGRRIYRALCAGIQSPRTLSGRLHTKYAASQGASAFLERNMRNEVSRA